FPQVASTQLTGTETGTSTICTTWVSGVSAPDSAACGTKPPMTTAAMTPASPIRPRLDMASMLRVLDKPAIRKGGAGPGPKNCLGARWTPVQSLAGVGREASTAANRHPLEDGARPPAPQRIASHEAGR